MRITSITHVSSSEAFGGEYDVVLCSSGFESRATFVASRLDKNSAIIQSRKALAFNDRQTKARKRNDHQLRELGYELIASDGNDLNAIPRLLARAMDRSRGRCMTMLVDISSMTRAWYAGLLTFLNDSPAQELGIDVTFTYVPGHFSAPPQESAPLVAVDFLRGFCGVEDPSKPSALVIGLGYEQGRASAVVDMQDPDLTFVWIASPGADERYIASVKANNEGLLKQLTSNHIIHYPLHSLEQTTARLESLCVGLQSTHRVEIAPLGPKPFSLAALLVACAVPGVAVWRATAGVSGDVIDRLPSEEFSGLLVSFRPAQE